MKHLSANRNLGYTIQPVLFANLYFEWKFNDPARANGICEVVWVNTYEFYEKMYNPYEGTRGQVCNSKPVDGKYHPSVYELKKSIEQEGMQYPIPVMMNQSEQRLQFFSGMARIRYAMIHDYTSIDAIVEDTSELYNLQAKLCGTACARNALSRSPDHDDFIIGSVPLHEVKINKFSYI